MKNNLLLIIYLIIYSFEISYSQTNLINNAGFEYYNLYPDNHSQVERLTEWEEDQRDCWENNIHYYLHSPDFYFQSQYGWPNTYPHSGNGYIGMGCYELVQQKFHVNNKPINSKEYVMSMYIMLDPNKNYTSTRLAVRLGTNFQEYTLPASLCTFACADQTYQQHNSLGTEVNILELSLNDPSYLVAGTWQWHKISVTFTADQGNYDWFTIELQNPNYNVCDGSRGYVYIDDVQMTPSCELSCYPTSGIPAPVIESSCPTALMVSNLNNVSTAFLEVETITNPPQPIWSAMVYGYNHGITNPIHWWGGTNEGSPVANAIYMARLTCTNDCGTFEFSKQFVKVCEDGWTMNPYPNGPKVPNPCCLYDLWIHDENLSGQLSYKVGHDITAGPAVTILNGSNVLFEAGHAVVLNPGFSTEPNAVFNANILECPNFAILEPETIVSGYPVLPTDNTLEAYHESAIEQKNNYISISPNPNNGDFSISFNMKAEAGTLFIQNLMGQIVFSKVVAGGSEINDISLGSINKGVYFVTYRSEKEVLLKQKMIVE